ncbi:hypothetical protein ADL05_22800 [Nocardiopsis sp. NRRL B-16309]|nr:hypothetical protein ADL05_22800 [Nocardiopsis sp. NRRL B-16309]
MVRDRREAGEEAVEILPFWAIAVSEPGFGGFVAELHGAAVDQKRPAKVRHEAQHDGFMDVGEFGQDPDGDHRSQCRES